ncbi:MAG: hypothetical protein IKW43_04685 [Bacteroidaceae bacterium]|nr:hypothetical protein [Bacteroidaceae bacterium]
MSKKQFGANGLNALSTALNTVSEAVEKAESTPVAPVQPEPEPVVPEPQPEPAQGRGEAAPTATSYELAEKSQKKETVGVNIILPKDVYKRLQMMRIDLDGMPLRSLCLQLVMEGLERYEGKQ